MASLSVLLFHSLISTPKASLHPFIQVLYPAARWGWLGVHVFFAISGWCIAERISKGFERKEPGSHFAIDRCIRILPTYWTALIFAITMRIAASPFNGTSLVSCFPDGWRGWLGSVFLIDPYLGRSSFLLVSWSLVYELGFYFCAAVALVIASHLKVNRTALFVVGSLMCFMPWTVYRGSAPWRVLELWPDFFAGMAAWWSARRGARVSGYLVLSLMLAEAIVLPDARAAGRLTAIVTAWVLALAFTLDERISKLPFMRVLGWVGGISYSLYLIHVPLLSPLENLMGRWVHRDSLWFICGWLLAITITLIGATYLNRFVETPADQWRRRVLARRGATYS